MREKILTFLRKQNGKKYSIRALSEALGFTSAEDYKTLAKIVNELEEEARIVPNKKNEYTLIEYSDYAKGVLQVKKKGFGFLLAEEADEDDIYIAKENMNNAMHNDRVLVRVRRSPKGFKKEGVIERILERNYTHLVGTIAKKGEEYRLLPDERSLKMEILVPKTHLNDAKVDDKVRARILSYAFEDKRMVCKVERIVGEKTAPGVDITSKVLKHGIEEEFPRSVLAEAKSFPEIDTEDKGRRKDFRSRPVVTIDGADAKDFDDAVEVEKLDDATFFLGVHIADVSHYVQEGSELDQEAFKRGTSIYLVDRVIPMLPKNLSNNLCSLMPGRDRYALSLFMRIDTKGKIIDHEIHESIIRSKARLTYKEVNRILAGDEETKKKRENLLPMIEAMEELARILREQRTKKGSLHFETDEAEITLDDAGKAIGVTLQERGESERFIEEFMLVANKVVARHVYWTELPFLYRVHEEPKEEKLEQLLTVANALGFGVKGKKAITHKELQKLLQKVEDTAGEKGINMMMLRSMQKAVYHEKSLGHFGLAFDHYTHFTSPIRRYPDLIVHRLLREYFLHGRDTLKTAKRYEKRLPMIAEYASVRERKAIDLERDVADMKKAEYMEDKIGETFEGHINGVVGHGIYVSLANTIEGLIHISELADDYYVFDEEHLLLVGRRKKKVYRMGEAIRVQVRSVSIVEGEIDFVLAGGD